MSLPSGSPSRRSSRFLELIHTIATGSGGSKVGFHARAAEPKRQAALLASLSRFDSATLAAAIAAGANAVEVRIDDQADLRSLARVIEGLKVPVGVVVGPAAGAELAGPAAEAGIDWVRLPLETPIGALEWEKPARIISLPFDTDLRLISALNGLQVDAALIEGSVGAAFELSIGDALRLRTLGEVIKKPILAHVGLGLPPSAAVASIHLGVDALVVPVDGVDSTGILAEYAAALERPAAGA